MKILHVYEAAHAQADLIAQGLLEAGHETDVKDGECDVVHVHGALAVASRLNEWSSYVQQHRAVPLIQYETSEIRSRSEAVRSNFYAHLDDGYSEVAAELLERVASVFPGCIVESAEAAEYAAKFHRRVYILPPAIRLPSSQENHAGWIERLFGNKIVIAHFAADESKGSEFIEKAISRLQDDGYDIQYERAWNLDSDDAVKLMAKADIVVDQLFHGSYSRTAVVAMALGKPVLSHLREDLTHRIDPELPIVSANPASLYRQLIPLLDNEELRRTLGERGRALVQKNHALEAVIPKLITVYRNASEPLSQEQNVAMVYDLMTGNAYSIERNILARGSEPPHQPVDQPNEGAENRNGPPVGAIPEAPKRSRNIAGRASRKRRRSNKRSRNSKRRKTRRGRRLTARAIGRSSKRGSKKRAGRGRRRLVKAGAVRSRRAKRSRVAG